MTVRRQLLVFAFGFMVLGPGAVARSQSGPGDAAGTGVQPRYLKPCGHVISLSDLGDDVRSGCAAPASCAAPPQCSAGPRCSSSCAADSCCTCRARCVGSVRAALDRLVQQIFACPKCDCPRLCCEAPPACTAHPACGCDVPYVPAESAPAIPRTEGNPFRDDSVQPSLPPKRAANRSRPALLRAQPTPAEAEAEKRVPVPPPAMTIKTPMAIDAPRLLSDE